MLKRNPTIQPAKRCPNSWIEIVNARADISRTNPIFGFLLLSTKAMTGSIRTIPAMRTKIPLMLPPALFRRTSGGSTPESRMGVGQFAGVSSECGIAMHATRPMWSVERQWRRQVAPGGCDPSVAKKPHSAPESPIDRNTDIVFNCTQSGLAQSGCLGIRTKNSRGRETEVTS